MKLLNRRCGNTWLRQVLIIWYMIILAPVPALSQTELWIVQDSTFGAQNGSVVALPTGSMYVVSRSIYGPGVLVFKYDANGNSIFHKVFSLGNYDTFIYDQVVDNNQNLYVCGKYDIYTTIGFVMKIDSNGNQMWLKEFSEPQYELFTRSLATDDSMNVYVTGDRYSDTDGHQDIFTAKINETGGMVWLNYYGNGTDIYEGNCIAIDKEGFIITAGSRINYGNHLSYLTLLKYNAGGSTVWNQEFTQSIPYAYFTVTNVALDDSGNIFTGGQLEWNELMAAKFDATGEMKWFQNFNSIYLHPGTLFHTGALDKFSNYYTAGRDSAGHLLIVKFSASGNLEWQLDSCLLANGADGTITDMKVRGNQVFVCGELDYTGPLKNFLVMVLDLNGNILWNTSYDGPGDSGDEAGSIDLDPEGNVLVSGMSFLSQSIDFYATTIKYNNLATFVSAPLKWVNDIHLFPNPAANDLTIKFGAENHLKTCEIAIYDFCGTQRWEKSCMITGNAIDPISLAAFPNGIYFVHVSLENVAVTKKMVVCK